MTPAAKAATAAAVLSAALALPAALAPRESPRLRRVEAAIEAGGDDPRLAALVDALSPGERARLRGLWRELPRERLAQRGALVYALGRRPDAPQDWDLLEDAAAQAPCLSLSDCARPSRGADDAADAVTLAYPALVAVRQAARALRREPRGPFAARARALLARAARSPVPALKRQARRPPGAP